MSPCQSLTLSQTLQVIAGAAVIIVAIWGFVTVCVMGWLHLRKRWSEW